MKPQFRVARSTSLVALALLTLAVGTPKAHAGTTPKVIVSLTFDDGFASAMLVATELRHFHLRGTFFINSGLLGRPGRLTAAQVREIAVMGNEIGGHSVGHLDLAAIDAAEVRRQVCADREALSAIAGSPPTDFAYPYGAYTATTARAVRSCGYSSARAVGGLQDGSCPACAVAEAVPPPDQFAIRTGLSLVKTTPAAAAIAQVQAVVGRGTGWLPLVFHGVCDGCSDIAVTPKSLTTLLAALVRMRSDGVVVETMADVLRDRARPLVAPPAAHSGTTLVDPALATPGLGNFGPSSERSFCWEETGYGQNRRSFARLRIPGGWSERITVRNARNGDAKLIIRRDLGTCSLAPGPDSRLTLGVTYRSSAPVRLVLFTTDGPANWRFFAGSRSAPASTTWRVIRWSPPPLPRNAERASFGVALSADGTAEVSGFDLAVRGGPLLSAAAWTRLGLSIAAAIVVGLMVAAHRGRRRRSGATIVEPGARGPTSADLPRGP